MDGEEIQLRGWVHILMLGVMADLHQLFSLQELTGGEMG